MTPAVATHVGGCQCGLVRYEITAELGPVFHCHCAFCRRIHGAAFTTIALLPREAFDWLSGSGHVARFLTPGGSLRHFCGSCASPLCNHPQEPKLLCLVVASLDDDSAVRPWAHFNTESGAPWFTPGDDLPVFPGNPTPEIWATLARENRRSS
jgi:hypothetical protein